VASARETDADLLIGLGGGSSMDTAKGCNFIFTNGGKMSDYHGTGKATRPMLPLIAIPTTSGTGSECQSYALISDAGSDPGYRRGCHRPRRRKRGLPEAERDFCRLQPGGVHDARRRLSAGAGGSQ
jgi:hypothetical protein